VRHGDVPAVADADPLLVGGSDPEGHAGGLADQLAARAEDVWCQAQPPNDPPHLSFSRLEAKITDVMGLYLHPPANAVVVCVDEKSQVQALERTQPILPMRPGIPERQTHDYARHGITCLFAALNTATGEVTDACYPRHRHQEFLKFLKKVAAAYPAQELHVVCDNYSTHKHAEVKAWLVKNPRITLHFTPTGYSWLNLVECFFSIITRQAIRRGSFTSVKQLVATIGTFIDDWNDHPRPFTWTKDAGEIISKINCAKTKTSGLTEH